MCPGRQPSEGEADEAQSDRWTLRDRPCERGPGHRVAIMSRGRSVPGLSGPIMIRGEGKAGVSLGSILFFVAACCAACGADPCANRAISQSYSPDREFKAVVFQRDCGATTGFSTQVSVFSANEHFLTEGSWLSSTKPGNVFVADTDHGKAPSGTEGGPVVGVEWAGPRRLRITHDKRARVFVRERTIDNVELVYLER
jgi:hypothetical protein